MKNLSIFVATIILNGGVICLFVAGIFYACATDIHGSDTPVRCVNAPASAVGVIVSGTGRNRFFISGPQTFSKMTNKEKCLNGENTPNSNRITHETGSATVRLPITSNPYSIPCFADFMAEAQRRFDVERTAKNEAYAFILSNGLLSEFIEFSRAYSGECQSIESKLETILKNC